MRILATVIAFSLAWAGAVEADAQVTPRVDHHTHLWSADASEVMVDPLPPEIDPGGDLRDLLRRRAARSAPRDASSLFTEDALFLDITRPGWIRGRAAIEGFLGGVQPGYRFRPSSIHRSRGWALLTGTLVRGEGDQAQQTRSFHLTLVRPGKHWLIAAESWSAGPPPVPRALSTEQLVGEVRSAGLERAVVFSAAHLFASALEEPRRDERQRLEAENEWLAKQVMPHRELVGFCSLNPLRAYAVAELERCVNVLRLAGLKLHLPDSGVNLLDPDHIAALRKVFEAADRLRVPVVVHLAGAGPRSGDRVRAFLAQIGPAAPNITIQIAHLGGTGPGLDDPEALEAFSDAAQAGRLPSRLVLDVSSVVTTATPEAELPRIAAALRRLGVKRLVFGSDRSGDRNEAPADSWRAFRRLPLSEAEFQEIADAGSDRAP